MIADFAQISAPLSKKNKNDDVKPKKAEKKTIKKDALVEKQPSEQK